MKSHLSHQSCVLQSPEPLFHPGKGLHPSLPVLSPLNLRSLGGDVASDGDFLIFEGNRYSRKGFLFKSFAMSAVVRPSGHCSWGGAASFLLELRSPVVCPGQGFLLLVTLTLVHPFPSPWLLDYRGCEAHPIRTGKV